MSAAPKYRDDIAGQVAAFISDFEASVRGELANPERDEFLFSVEETCAYDEFKDYLTEREMAAAFKRAQRAGALA